MARLTLTSNSPEETARLAAALAKKLQPGDTILLIGDVGAGKTHFARALIQSLLDMPEDVPSPTFTLVQSYQTAAAMIWHADLYRLTSTHEIEELGLTEAFHDAICLVEWPDRLGELAPVDALSVSLKALEPDDERQLIAEWQDQKWINRLAEWQ